MLSFEDHVELRRVKVWHNDAAPGFLKNVHSSSDAISTTLCAFQSRGPAPAFHATDSKPLRKRRKLHGGKRDDVQLTRIDLEKSVVLGRVSLNLSWDQSGLSSDRILTDLSPSKLNLHVETPVSLVSFQHTGEQEIRFVLSNQHTKANADIVISASDLELTEKITPILRIAEQFSSGRPSTRAAFCRCLLISSRDGQYESESCNLLVEVRWELGLSVVESPSVTNNLMKRDLEILSQFLRNAGAEHGTKWSLSDFFDAVHVPPQDLQVSPRIQHSLSETSLYPFQQRAVDWLLRREGVAYSALGDLESFQNNDAQEHYEKAQDALGRQCYVSYLRGLILSDLKCVQRDEIQTLRGGILAEEMGLGKTVELIALISHHKRVITEERIFDSYTGAYVKPSGATLIITPPSILEQWISELQSHAPELKVLHYKGFPPASARKAEREVATIENLMRYEVVLTTYSVLSKEVHYAKPPPDRAFRNARRPERRRSPLVEISWWRVCLDEAQMVESGVSQAATVARIIPRCNAWAVSGTPLRKNVQDLRGLLIFLRCEVIANNKDAWHRLDNASFRAIFGQLALRHTKDSIREELRLPSQKRVVITVPFTAIEEQNYSEMIRQMCDACFMTPDGTPTREDYDATHPEVIERMREWLARLRQTCLHAHVGRKNRKALGSKNGPLRTVDDVLEVMIEQNDSALKSAARDMITIQLTLGHIKAYAGNVEDRAQTALPFYEIALEEAKLYATMCREELSSERVKLRGTAINIDRAVLPEDATSDMEEEIEDEVIGRISGFQKSLRSFLELEHACNFFIATTYHQIKENTKFTTPNSEDFHRLDKLEVEWYEKAKAVRRELVREPKGRALRQMDKVKSKKPLQPIARIDDLPSLGGIESWKILSTMDTISDYLNAQADQFQKWRMKIVDILLTRLVDDDDNEEITGEEYNDSLKVQDELYVYIMALRTLVADRNAAITGLQDLLIDHELKAAEKQARSSNEDMRGHAPELVLEIAETRRKLQATLDGASLKGIISGLRSLVTTLQWKAEGGDARAAAELSLLQRYQTKVQAVANEQSKAVAELEKEQELFRATMNQRLEYYRQFQVISDTVAQFKDELDPEFDAEKFRITAIQRRRRVEAVSSLKTKSTYLVHLRSENQKDVEAECIICQDPIEIGVLTTCGHKYCKICINTWWQTHRSCPMCKQKLNSSDFKAINFKPSELKAQQEDNPQDPSSINSEAASSPDSTSGSSGLTSIYTDISDATLREIKQIDLDGSYGSKIDMIARHLLWLRVNDPGAKSIIFSQFGDFLDVLREALSRWKLGCASISDKDGITQFRSSPSVEAFLLDAKVDSSGLNLVNATYVFLCEPLINPALELQAIARVHRIGQQRPTTVFMYLVSDTVEEAIYEISVARRLEHISASSARTHTGKDKDAVSCSGTAAPLLAERTLDAANSKELQAAPLKQLLRKKGDGEVVQAADLWHCLFGKQRKTGLPEIEREVGRHLRADVAERRAETGQMGV